MSPKWLRDYKTKVKDDFFDKFINTTETGYFVWRDHPDIKAGKWAGDIVSFIWKALDEFPKKNNG